MLPDLLHVRPSAPPASLLQPSLPVAGTRQESHKCFWAAAGLGWLIWVLAVAAASDDNWATSNSSGASFGVGHEDVEDTCDSAYANESACAACKCSVPAAQLTAVFFYGRELFPRTQVSIILEVSRACRPALRL